MDRHRMMLFINTVKYLKFKQIYYQLYYLIRNKIFKKNYVKEIKTKNSPLRWNESILYTDSFTNENKFTFLNLTKEFQNNLDWNYEVYGKLWTYNLNYFDFLNQNNMTPYNGLQLIKNYIKNEASLKDGKEPYPISLRGINWIKFLSKNGENDPEINQILYNHYQSLIRNLEYHLLGNHLLENGYSLLFAAYHFKDESIYIKARKILIEQLTEQVLNDGAHFELSPMYHQILLHRLLDCINLIRLNPWKQDDLLDFLQNKALLMLSWLQGITYSTGDIPMVNDSTFGIAPKSYELFNYAEQLGIKWGPIELMDSGYRMFRIMNYELFVDVGNVGPTYQPGHAHSDTFNFELYYMNKPVIVDTGISTYEKNSLRLKQRSTESHNTIMINNQEQTEVWDGFRVARRAKIIQLKEKPNSVSATHNGYKNLGVLHTRNFICEPNKITIQDAFSKVNGLKKKAFIHLHPSIKSPKIMGNKIQVLDGTIEIIINEMVDDIKIEHYEYSQGFNKLVQAKRIVVGFSSSLTTIIKFN